ncbi:protein turtle homolog B-like [Tachysurus ichikawai]
MEASGLTLNLKKCNLCRKSLSFLGHVISEEGIKTEETKVEAMKNFPIPRNLKEVQRFLGLAGWYHHFISGFSELAAPLHALKRKDAAWNWTEECHNDFERLKDALQKAPVLIPPDPSRPFKVQTDASNIGLGAVLTQESDQGEHVVAYASRLLHGAEKSYSVSEKECLAVVWAVEKWQKYLEGRRFQIITDHAARVGIQPSPTDIKTLEMGHSTSGTGFHCAIQKSKSVEVFPLRSAKTHVIADILVKEIFTRWGTPTYLVSDRGPQFTSQLLNATCKQ